MAMLQHLDQRRRIALNNKIQVSNRKPEHAVSNSPANQRHRHARLLRSIANMRYNRALLLV